MIPEDGTIGALPTTKTITWPGGPTSQQTFSYDNGFPATDTTGKSVSVPYGKQITETDNDYSPGGGTLKLTSNKYWALSGPNAAAYLAANFLDLPYTVQISSGSSPQTSTTTYGYDEAGYEPSAGTFGHLTTVTRTLDTGGSVVSHTYYDASGMPSKTLDPNGYATMYAYQCSDSLASTVTNPLSQTTTYVYNCANGLLTSIQDPNDFAAGRTGTSFIYNTANDLQQITYPDTGSTTYTYNGYAVPLTVTQTELATPDPSLVSSTTYDGLGRVASSTAPNGAITTTGYDLDGRISSVSNPHLSSPSPTDGTHILRL